MTTESVIRARAGAPAEWPTQADLFTALMDWESGAIDVDAEILLFAYLIRTGLAWSLQGVYGRVAANYIENDVISENGEIL